MSQPLRWLVELELDDGRGSKRKEVRLEAGQRLALGGPADVWRVAGPAVELEVTPSGVLRAYAMNPQLRLMGQALTEAELEVGQVLELGEAKATLRVPPHLEGQAAPPGAKRWQVRLEGNGEGRSHAVSLVRATGLVFTFGRVDLNALRLPIESLARRHVGLFIDAHGQIWGKDLGSPMGTWLGEARLDRWSPLPAEALLRAGQATLRVLGAPVEAG